MRTPILMHTLTMGAIHAMVEATRSQNIMVVVDVPRPTSAEIFEAMVLAEMSRKQRDRFVIVKSRDMLEPRLGPSTFRKASQPFAQFAKEPSKKQRNRKHF